MYSSFSQNISANHKENIEIGLILIIGTITIYQKDINLSIVKMFQFTSGLEKSVVHERKLVECEMHSIIMCTSHLQILPRRGWCF